MKLLQALMQELSDIHAQLQRYYETDLDSREDTNENQRIKTWLTELILDAKKSLDLGLISDMQYETVLEKCLDTFAANTGSHEDVELFDAAMRRLVSSAIISEERVSELARRSPAARWD